MITAKAAKTTVIAMIAVLGLAVPLSLDEARLSVLSFVLSGVRTVAGSIELGVAEGASLESSLGGSLGAPLGGSLGASMTITGANVITSTAEGAGGRDDVGMEPYI